MNKIEPPGGTKGIVSLMNFGTRKELLYASSQFSVLFNHFQNSLHNANVLVLVGYSFRDERINKIIEEAVITRKGGLRLVIVDPSSFQIHDSNPLLWKFRQLNRSKEITRPLGAVLNDGSLYKAVEASLKANIGQWRIPRIVHNVSKKKASKQQHDTKRILEAWQMLGITFDLVNFWMRFISSDIKRLKSCKNRSDAIEICQRLMPTIMRVRDMCHYVVRVYTEMNFGGPYSKDQLSSIKAVPKLIKRRPNLKLVRRWLPELSGAVSLAFGEYSSSTAEFKLAVANPNYGMGTGAPSNIHLAELIIRKSASRIDELVCILNDIYKGASYEAPFAALAEDKDE